MIDSILTTIKKQLGLEEEYEAYDQDILLLINSTFLNLNQINVGPKDGFHVNGNDEVWTDFLPEGPTLDAAKAYIYAKVRIIFDPPSSSFVLEAYNKQIAELEWRMMAQNDETIDYNLKNVLEEV